MDRFRNLVGAGLAAATFAAAVMTATPADARRCARHATACDRSVSLARAAVDLPLDVFIAAPAAPYSYYYAYPAPYHYVYASRGCIVRSGVYDGAGYFKGYQVLRVAC